MPFHNLKDATFDAALIPIFIKSILYKYIIFYFPLLLINFSIMQAKFRADFNQNM